MNPRTKPSGQGLTLLELLVVTTVTMLVSVATFPAVAQLLGSARTAAAARSSSPPAALASMMARSRSTCLPDPTSTSRASADRTSVATASCPAASASRSCEDRRCQ